MQLLGSIESTFCMYEEIVKASWHLILSMYMEQNEWKYLIWVTHRVKPEYTVLNSATVRGFCLLFGGIWSMKSSHIVDECILFLVIGSKEDPCYLLHEF